MKGKVKKNGIGLWAARKGLMVLLVVFGHSVNDGAEICGRITVYPIPFRVLAKGGGAALFIFFMINGYLFKPKKKDEIKKQYFDFVKIYGITILLMLAGVFVRYAATSRAWQWAVLRLFTSAIYGGTNMTYVGEYRLEFPYAMWFFAVLMNSWLILELLMNVKRESVRRLLIAVVPGVFFLVCHALNLTGTNPMVNWPFYIVQTGVAVVLLYTGYQIRKHDLLFRDIPWYCWAGITAAAVLTYLFGKVDMLNNGYRLGVFDLIGCICFAFLSMKIYIQFVNPDCRVIEWLMWIGRRSLWLIPAHCVEWALVGWQEFAGLSVLGIYGAVFVIFISRTIVIILACVCCEKVQMWLKKRKLTLIQTEGNGAWNRKSF